MTESQLILWLPSLKLHSIKSLLIKTAIKKILKLNFDSK